MSRRCPITGSRVEKGCNVSHANNKTIRTFVPNLQPARLMSEILGVRVGIRVSTRGLRTIEHNGGLDAYLLSTPNSRLTDEALALKKRVLKAKAKKDGADEAAPKKKAPKA